MKLLVIFRGEHSEILVYKVLEWDLFFIFINANGSFDKQTTAMSIVQL